MDLIRVTEKFAYRRKNRPCKFNVYRRKDEPGRLSRLNACRSCKAKPPYTISFDQVA